LYALPGHQGLAVAVSPDGERFVRQEGEGTTHGSLVVRDLRTGAAIVELQGLCTWDTASEVPAPQQPGCAAYPEPPFGISTQRLKWSPDGAMVATVAGDDDGRDVVAVWDAQTGALLHAESPERDGVADVHFTPDSALLSMTPNHKDHRVLSTRTWEVVSTGMGGGGAPLGIVGFSPDRSKVLVAVSLMLHTGAQLAWFDVVAQDLTLTRFEIHEGTLNSVALSDDGARVATASSDGLVRVWDGPTLELIDEIRVGDGSVQGVAFVGDHHLAVAPQGGDLVLVTTDPDELLELVRSSLTRGFTATECTRFRFGDECPTLAELRGPADGADDPRVLDGTYEVFWTDQQFDLAFNRTGAPRIVGTRTVADDYAGTYTLTFDGGRFDIVHDGRESFCTGSYEVTGDRVLLFAERREPQSGCRPGRFLDARYAITDSELMFADTTAHPVDAVLFANRPLARLSED
ncbi:MAG TPA: hypothetical protein VGK49_06805, partial [Ilumatobacteraceae bacterium]